MNRTTFETAPHPECTTDTASLPTVNAAGPPVIKPREALLVGVVALVIYSALLVRMPYRTTLLNGLYTGLALSALYLYLRYRLNIQLPLWMLMGLVVGALLDIIGNRFNLFSQTFGFLAYDVFTHFVTAALSLIPVMWLVRAWLKRFDYRLPLGAVAFFSVTATFSLSAYYEILELCDEKFFGGHRIWTTHDTVHDLASDLGGIVVAALGYSLVILKRRSKASGEKRAS